MIDFPASPTNGQVFRDPTSNLSWTWDGAKWVAAGLAGGPFLPLSGGTLSGGLGVTGVLVSGYGLNLAPTNNAGAILLNGSSVNYGDGIAAQIAGSLRWWMALADGSAESGGNAGSNFALRNYSDTGTPLGTPLSINRASGLVTVPNLSAPQAIGSNRIINGDCRIDQRNNGVSAQAIGYTVDRWAYGATQANRGTWQRVVVGSPLSPFPYSLRFQNSTTYTLLATDHFGFSQAIEADMVSDFQWGTVNAQPVTLSFWIYSSNPGAYSGSVSNYAGTRSYPFLYSISTISAWTYVTITIPGDTAGTWVMNGNVGALYVNFDLGSGVNFRGPASAWASGNFLGVTGAFSVAAIASTSFCVTGVKLEVGSVATPFNRQTMAKSLADCQRYYQVIAPLFVAGFATAGVGIYIPATLPTPMRASPTGIMGPVTSPQNCTTQALAVQGPVSFYHSAVVTAAGSCTFQVSPSFSAEL